MQLLECIYGMSKAKLAKNIEVQNTPEILRIISNPKRWSILQYLHAANFATAVVIQRRCQIQQPTVSRHLKTLTKADLITREKIGTSVIYQINSVAWKQWISYLSKLEK